MAVNACVQTRRDALRQAGLRPVQSWVPDTRRADFAEQRRRQCELAIQVDRADEGVHQIMDAALAEMKGWTA